MDLWKDHREITKPGLFILQMSKLIWRKEMIAKTRHRETGSFTSS